MATSRVDNVHLPSGKIAEAKADWRSLIGCELYDTHSRIASPLLAWKPPMLFQLIERFDHWSVVALNSYVNKHAFVDKALTTVQSSSFFKCGPIVGMLIWAWSGRPQSARTDQRLVVAIVLGAGIAIAAGRIAQLLLPHRFRPMHDPEIDFSALHGASNAVLEGWSSFPSDHAVYFAALATGLYVFDKRLGLAAAIWSIFVIWLPRIYLGFHYPSDIVVGAILGVAVMDVAVHSQFILTAADSLIDIKRHSPSVFFPVAVLVVWQMGVMFDDVRHAGSMASSAFKHLAGQKPAITIHAGRNAP